MSDFLCDMDVRYVAPSGSTKPRAAYRCPACGRVYIAVVASVRRGASKTCGCTKKTHGENQVTHPEYQAWRGMKVRCSSDSPKYKKSYKDRGITVCDEWAQSYETFLDHVGRRPTSAHSLDRINNDLGYEPGNVRWATAKQQANNRRKPTRDAS